MTWMRFTVFFFFLTLALGEDVTECDPTKQIAQKESLNETMRLPESYKVSGIISNWITNTTTAFTEAATTEGISTLLSSRNESLQWISVKPDASLFLFDRTSGQCRASTSLPLATFPELSKISANLTSLSTLLSGLVDSSKTNPGELRDNRVVAGVEGVRWVSCVNGTNGTANRQIEVVFAGVGSLKQPSPAFNNPLVLSIRVSEYGNFSDKKSLKSQLSIEFDRHDVVSADDNQLFSTPAGTVCAGWKGANIPRNISDPYNAFIETVDENGTRYENMVQYSTKDELVIVGGARKAGLLPIINETNLPNGVVSVIHDFTKGYEYVLDYSRCHLSALSNNSADVVVSSEGTFLMRPLADILIAPELKFGHYGQIKADNGRTLDMFRSFDNRTGTVIEVHFDGNWLEKFITYKFLFTPESFVKHLGRGGILYNIDTSPLIKLVNGRPLLSSYSRYSQMSSIRPSQYEESIRSCFVQSVQSRNDSNTFIFEVKSKSVKDVYSQGVENVTSALANALIQIAPINPHRLRVFYDSGPDNSLRVFFSVSEKSDQKPAIVPRYNFTAEVSSSDFLQKLNETITRGDWKFSVLSGEGKPEDWVVAARSLNRYAPSSPSKTGYVGYTGGAMFVLGLFSLILGVAIGAGGVFFVTKRQRISTLAYQVFE